MLGKNKCVFAKKITLVGEKKKFFKKKISSFITDNNILHILTVALNFSN